jgi:hypothetical protein
MSCRFGNNFFNNGKHKRMDARLAAGALLS